MGIDAQMYVVVTKKPTEDDLLRWSGQLSRSIGSEYFRIEPWSHEGLKPVESGCLTLAGSKYREDDDPPPGTFFHQDGPTAKAKKGEWFIEVKLMSRYYGIGYERGPLLTFCAIAEWLELHPEIKPKKILYGGDSSGVLAEPFDQAKRLELKKHLFSAEGRDYFNHGKKSAEYGFGPDDTWEYGVPDFVDKCKICKASGFKYPTRYGTGQGYSAMRCGGCGKRFETKDSGKTWSEPEDRF